MSSKKSTNSGLGFSGWLTLLFIALKLTGQIDWSWWWVVSPIWIGILVAFIAIVAYKVIDSRL